MDDHCQELSHPHRVSSKNELMCALIFSIPLAGRTIGSSKAAGKTERSISLLGAECLSLLKRSRSLWGEGETP